MSTTVASLAEVYRARLFLKTIGAYGPTNLMILAVVAFLRVTNQNTNKLVVATARLLLKRTVYALPPPGPYGGPTAAYVAQLKADAIGYQMIVTAARKGHASEFLIGLAFSNWSPTHFGGWSPAGIDSAKNRLFQTYGSFTGLESPPVKEPVRKPLPELPRGYVYIASTREYIDPYAAGTLYSGRRHAVDTRPRRR